MAHLAGYGNASYIAMDDSALGVSPSAASSSPSLALIDGTPVRVCVLAIAAAVGLTALKMAGIRFNVGVSS